MRDQLAFLTGNALTVELLVPDEIKGFATIVLLHWFLYRVHFQLKGYGSDRCNIRVKATDLSGAEHPDRGFLFKKYLH